MVKIIQVNAAAVRNTDVLIRNYTFA